MLRQKHEIAIARLWVEDKDEDTEERPRDASASASVGARSAITGSCRTACDPKDELGMAVAVTGSTIPTVTMTLDD